MFGYSDTVRSSPLTVTLFCRSSTVTVSGQACTLSLSVASSLGIISLLPFLLLLLLLPPLLSLLFAWDDFGSSASANDIMWEERQRAGAGGGAVHVRAIIARTHA